MDPITQIAEWLRNLLLGWGLQSGLVTFFMALIAVLVIILGVLVFDVFLVWVERKVVARFQDRLGPNRIGPYGLIQPFADIIKLLIKEDITPDGADRFVYNIAPLLATGCVLLLWAVIPFAPTLLGSDINVGVLFIVAVGAIATLSILMAGWSSNNKYALVGAFRTVAQMVSYEVPMVITLLVPVLLSGSMGVHQIVAAQQGPNGTWFILVAPVAAILFLISSIAELGRSPFDLIEAESEIVAGFHIEYTGMKFGLFYAAELLHAFTIGALFSTLFLGGWAGPGVQSFPLLGILYLWMKAFLLYFVIMWIKYTVPRIRIDHMLSFNWKFLTPLALALLMVIALLQKLFENASLPVFVLVMLAANILLALFALSLTRNHARRERKKVAEPRPVARPPEPQVS